MSNAVMWQTDSSAWGREISRSTGEPPHLQYTQRRRRVPELLLDVRRWGDREHLVDPDRRLTFAQHEAAVVAVSRELSAVGVGRGTPVLFLAGNCIEWVVSYWAVLRLGAVAVLGNAWWSPEEVRGALEKVGAGVVLTDEARQDRLPDVPHVLLSSLAPLLDDLPAAPPDQTGITGRDGAGDEDEAAVVIFTSGTTGAPKGVVLSHRAVIANLHNLLNVMGRLPSDLGPEHVGGVSLQTIPLFHMGGIQTIGMTLLTGGSLVFPGGRFDPGEVLALIERERVTTWGCVPTMMSRVLDHPDLDTRDVSSLRSVTMGGAPVPPALSERAARVFPGIGRSVNAVYGLTEAGGSVTAASGKEAASHPGTVGRPLPVVEVAFADVDDAGVGEILVRSPANMTEYWGEAASPVDEDGYLHTGDLGRFDEDGYLHLVGRSKDIIIRGGENIAAPHVEARLREHPDVAEVAVLGLPHDDLGEEVGAVVVPQSGADVSSDELEPFVRERLAHFEVPTRWWIRAEPLPTTMTGKVRKADLKQAWEQR